MQISSQLFDRILGVAHRQHDTERKAPVLPVGCRRATERRAVTRVALGHRANICADRGRNAGQWETVMMQDISLAGVGLLSQREMEKGETFIIKVSDRDQQMIRIRCAVKRCERGGIGNASYLLGATFEQVIADRIVQLHDEDENLEWNDDADLALPADQTTAIRTTGSALRRVARSFFKVLSPHQWLKRADDYSSIG